MVERAPGVEVAGWTAGGGGGGCSTLPVCCMMDEHSHAHLSPHDPSEAHTLGLHLCPGHKLIEFYFLLKLSLVVQLSLPYMYVLKIKHIHHTNLKYSISYVLC